MLKSQFSEIKAFQSTLSERYVPVHLQLVNSTTMVATGVCPGYTVIL